MNTQRISYDIWVHIASWLPQSQLRQLLQVSRTLHDAAFPFLFSSVKLYFMDNVGTGYVVRTTEPETEHQYEIQHKQIVMRSMMERSWELLHRVIEDSWFAGLVRELIFIKGIHWFSLPEKYMIKHAMRALINLRTFRYYQPLTPLTQVSTLWAEDILNFIPPTIEHFACPLLTSVDFLKSLHSLKSLECQRKSSVIYGDDLPLGLQRLAISKYDASHVPPSIFRNLRVLEILYHHFYKRHPILDLQFACRHCDQLEELSLVGALEPGILTGLPRESSFMPKLHSLRIVIDSLHLVLGEDCVTAVECFLNTHQRLRRLCLDIPDFPWTKIMGSISAVQSLEVFGLHVGKKSPTTLQLISLMSKLPKGVKALHLRMVWNTSKTLRRSGFLKALAHLPLLTSLSIINGSSFFPFTAEEFATELPNLKTVGLEFVPGAKMWDIKRFGSVVKAIKWQPWKVAFPVDSDFDDEDDAWLYKCPPRMRR